MSEKRVLYCHCAYAKVVPAATKAEVLRRLAGSQRDFDAVPDLCEMSARSDPALTDWAADPAVEIVACFPRAVRWLFHAAGAELDPQACIHNMRTSEPAAIAEALGLASPDPASPASTGEVSG